MRILLSSLLFLLVGCASYPTKNNFAPTKPLEEGITNPYFSDSAKDYVYKAKIEAFDNGFGGILAVKKLGEAHHRLVFTTEMGNTIFDFTFKENEFKVNRILKELDRKILINILKRDFAAMLTEHPLTSKSFKKEGERLKIGTILDKNYYYLFKNGQLAKIVRTKKSSEKVIILFEQVSGKGAENIVIAHKNIKLRIDLNAI